MSGESLIRNSITSEKGCVYNIPCKGCISFTQVKVVLLNNIRNSVRYGQESNAIFVYRREFCHQTNWSNIKIIAYNN